MSKNEQVINAEMCGNDFTFTINREDYNKYINATTQNNKVAPCHNLLMTTIDPKQKATLKTLLAENVGSEVQLASAVLEEYTPDLGIVVKKSSSAHSE
jgi:hypothetical protein